MQQGLAAAPQDGSGHAMMLANVGVVLLAQYQEDGKEKNLEAALDAARRSVAATSSDNKNSAAYLSFLGNALLAQ
jgi:hypothetical protein